MTTTPEVFETSAGGGYGERGERIGARFADDLRRRLGGREERIPGRDVESRHAGFGDRRHFGQRGVRFAVVTPRARSLPP
jgi:hypothetical protein